MTQEPQLMNHYHFLNMIDDLSPHACDLEALLELMDHAPLSAELESGWLTGIFVTRQLIERNRKPLQIEVTGFDNIDILSLDVGALNAIVQSSMPMSKFEMGLVSGMLATRQMHKLLTQQFN
jgi:hypothetical protein